MPHVFCSSGFHFYCSTTWRSVEILSLLFVPPTDGGGMEINMFFSIIVTAYNVEKYIRKCLESIRKQIFEDFEVIIIDDGSTDDTPYFCDEYSECDHRFKVIHQKNGGVVSARKTGAKNVTGEYLVTVDGDDEIEENLLYSLYHELIQKKPDLLAFGYKTINEAGIVENERMNDINNGYYDGETLKDVKSKFLYDNSRSGINDGNLEFSTWSKVIKVSIYYECIMKVDDRVVKGDDLLALIYIMQMAKSIMITDITGYHYRMQPRSLTHIFKIEDLYKQAILRDEIYKATFGDDSMINQASVCIFYTSYARVQELIGSETSYKEFKCIIDEVKEKHLFDCVYNMKCTQLSFLEKMKILIIKKGWWWLLYVHIKAHIRK